MLLNKKDIMNIIGCSLSLADEVTESLVAKNCLVWDSSKDGYIVTELGKKLLKENEAK